MPAKITTGSIVAVEKKKDKPTRITVAAGKSTFYVILTEEDVQLLVKCGHEAAAFQADHVFPEFARPYLRVVDGKLESVLDLSRSAYINHKGEAVLDVPKPVTSSAKESGASYDRLKSHFEALAAEKREKIPEDPTNEHRADAVSYIDGIKHIHNGLQQNLGRMMIIGMWQLRTTGLFMDLPNQPRDIAEAMRVFDGQWDDMDYIIKLARIVDRILPEVDAALKLGRPFTNPKTKAPLTVEDLIMGEGLVKKLGAHSDHFSKLISPEDKQQFLSAVVTQSNAKVAALKDQQQAITVAETSDTPVQVRQTQGKDGRYKIEMEVSEAQLHAIQRLLKPLVGENWKI